MLRIVLAATIAVSSLAPAQQAEKNEVAAISESKPNSGSPKLDEAARKNILDKIRVSQRPLKGTLLYRIDGGAVVRTENGGNVYLHGPIPNVAENGPIA